MIQKTLSTILIFVLGLALVACSALSNLATALPSVAPVAATPDNTLENKLAAGILKLEGTSLAVSTEQANSLLGLWQGVRLLTSNKSSSTLELTALYQQIQASLTADQVQAIQELSWTQEELTAWMKAAGGVGAAGNTTARKTSSSQTTQTFDGGPGGGGGMPGGGPGGNSDLALVNGVSSPNNAASIQTTPIATKAATTITNSITSGLNAQLASAVIDLLQKRAMAASDKLR